MRRLFFFAVTILAQQLQAAEAPPAGKTRYLRPAGDGWALECEFEVRSGDAGWKIGSTTHRGKTQLSVQAAYDKEDNLLSGEIILRDGKQDHAAIIKRNQNKVDIRRAGAETQSFEVSPGVIVTSAPDWTDVFLLCRRYRHADGGRQTFAALWVHPQQPTQLLKLAIERQGHDTIQHDGKDLKLARFTIELRGKSQYAAWATMEGTLVRLIPLPQKAKLRSGLIHDRYAKSAAAELSLD
jgi:hypothetical protein